LFIHCQNIERSNDQLSKVNLAIIYYSSTGTNYQLAQWAAVGAKQAGAEVSIFKVQELAPEKAIDANPAWRAHVDATKHVPEATAEDQHTAQEQIGRHSDPRTDEAKAKGETQHVRQGQPDTPNPNGGDNQHPAGIARATQGSGKDHSSSQERLTDGNHAQH